jgi:hypothetical protein
MPTAQAQPADQTFAPMQRIDYIRRPQSLANPQNLQRSFRTHEVLLSKMERHQEESLELRLAYEASLGREQRLLALNHNLQRLAEDRKTREEHALTAARRAQIELEEERAKVRGLVTEAARMQRQLEGVLASKSWCEAEVKDSTRAAR